VLANPGGPYAAGQVITVTATLSPGWRFVGWSGDLDGTVNPVALTINSNKVVTATFARIQYHLIIAIVGGQGATGGAVTITPLQEFYFYNEEVTLTATPAAGYRFSGWTIEETGRTLATAAVPGPIEPEIKVKITGDVTYTANFEPIFSNVLFLPLINQAK